MAYGTADAISKPAWRYIIWDTLDFGSFRAAKMTPFWNPNFHPRVVNWRPHISVPMRSPDLILGLALRYESRSRLLSCEPLALP